MMDLVSSGLDSRMQFGMLGVIATANNRQFVRGTNFIGRGTRAGQFTFDPGPADSFKR